ncbi:DUF6252 family protein [Flavobacterium acetivorans]|uniref:DUF6252 family protein n=1 Tax=Flavobacterium acetivorans TaxID=2893883 RepID=UPI001E39895C|nr:DUF6252 family protein [Flavobacterium sp. F-29]UFH36475.1 DUF6252 family protein [Flavobacterium sp. F-29]
MKKYLVFISMLSFLISCQEDVKFNNPSFQGVKDNVFWRAVDSKAILEANGGLTIEAYSRNEVITLKTTSALPQTYFLGNSTSKRATYILTEADGTIIFSTGIGFGDGQIVITEYDELGRTVSGTFKFNAVNSSNNPFAGEFLNFQQGIFYKVPLVQ